MKRIKMNDGESSAEANQFPIIINTPADNIEAATGIRVIENKVFFYGEISEQSCLELNRILVELDMKLQNIKNNLGDEYTPIIHLHLNTPGGCIYSAFSTVDIIRNLKCSLYTYVIGLCASAGTLISTIGQKRFMGKHSHLLIHQLSSGTIGTFSDMQADITTCENLMHTLKEFYKRQTKIPVKKLQELMSRDVYLNAEECVSYNIVDTIM
jgi:ATP-dependent Clp protease, protease subunit